MGTYNTLYSNSFQGANQNPLSDGGKWTVTSSYNLQILNEMLTPEYNEGSYLFGEETLTGVNLTADCWFQYTLASFAGSPTSEFQVGVTLRGGYGFSVIYSGAGQVFNYSVNDPGNNTIIQGSVSMNVGDTIFGSCIGSTITLTHNGTQLGQVTNTVGDSNASLSLSMFYASSGITNFEAGSYTTSGGGGSSTIFLGSVVVLASAPAGRANPYVGKFTKVSSAPSGVPNPFLGSVVAGSAPAGHSDVSLGEVVEIASPPAGAPNPFLGTFEGT